MVLATAMAWLRRLRTGLDMLYAASGVAASLCLVTILLLIVLQMVARWTGEIFPGAPEYAGYAMAAASFLALADALNRGAHIRVSLLLNTLKAPFRRIVESLCFGCSILIAWFFVYNAIHFTYWSWSFSDISQGQDATQLWIPQAMMAGGATLFAIALSDHFIHLLVYGYHRIASGAIGATHET